MTSRNSQSQWELGSVRIYIWGRSDLVFLLGWAWLVVGSVVVRPVGWGRGGSGSS